MQDPTAAGAAFQAAGASFRAAGAAFQVEEPQRLPCPRCDSTNTKFCYYNNYNLSQPRHFCRDCRRYWTRGGTLRNVPVGGGTRKVPKRRAAATHPPSASSPPKRPDNDFPSTAASLRVGGDVAEPLPKQPPLTPLPDNFLRLHGEPTCRDGGGGRPDLTVRTPGSNP